MTKSWRFDALWREDGWLENAYVVTDDEGKILEISANPPRHEVESVAGYAAPGFQNAHSHAFQYAMAGLAEHMLGDNDDFWSWRNAMYALALTVSPEDLAAIAAMLYTEMLRNGFTAVAEFHYLHHDPKGDRYANPATMAQALIQAARETGIQLTLIPIFYRTGDFAKPGFSEQRRFLSASLDDYFKLHEATRRAGLASERCATGVGVHSLRAGSPEEIVAIMGSFAPDSPRHIHIAEQQKEVDGCLAALGQRPVAWLLDHLPVDDRFHLVHATHINREEMVGIARSGATVVLCPSTEGNLGDGFFPLRDYRRESGSWAIGTDSHIGLSPMEELRWLDYGQRMRLEKRNSLCLQAGEDGGETAFRQSLIGGYRAMGLGEMRSFAPGSPFDAVVLDSRHPLLGSRPPERRLATWLYACDASAFLGVLCSGRWVIQAGRHHRLDSVSQNFRGAMRQLRSRL